MWKCFQCLSGVQCCPVLWLLFITTQNLPATADKTSKGKVWLERGERREETAKPSVLYPDTRTVSPGFQLYFVRLESCHLVTITGSNLNENRNLDMSGIVMSSVSTSNIFNSFWHFHCSLQPTSQHWAKLLILSRPANPLSHLQFLTKNNSLQYYQMYLCLPSEN